MRLTRTAIVLPLLMAGVISSALGVVYARHMSRVSFTELQELERQRDDLAVEWGRLQLERAALAEASRVERRATEDLGLMPPEQHQVVVVQ